MREVSEVFSEAQAREAIEARAERKAGNAKNRSKSVPEDKYITARMLSIANDIRRGLAAATG